MFSRILTGLVASMGLAVAPAVAHADIFMLVTGVAGDSVAKGHEGWIRVSSLQWEVEADTSYVIASGASVGKPKPGELKLTLPTGIWSQHFARMITQGKALAKVTIDATASDGRPLYRATLDGMYATKYGIASLPATPLPQDTLECVFQILKIEYYATAADGKLITTYFEWNVSAGKSAPVL